MTTPPRSLGPTELDRATVPIREPVDGALGLRVVRFKTPPAAVDLVGHTFGSASGFADVRLTDMEHEAQPLDVHGNPD